jgi:hypothetical protein
MGRYYAVRSIPNLFILVAGWAALAMFAGSAGAQVRATSEPGAIGPLDPVSPGITADRVFAELVAQNEARNAVLAEYMVLRTYQVVDLKGKVHAEIRGQMEYHAPDKKVFLVASETGSYLVRRLALHPLIAGEIEAASGKEHRNSSFTPANYTLDLLGEQQIESSRCFVALAVPKRKDKYLFEGKVWIDVRDYAIVRIEGHPAERLSFWINRADFVRQYQKINGFWLPQQDKTLVQVRVYGKHVLAIDYQDYVLEPAIYREGSVQDSINSRYLHQAQQSGARDIAAAR